MSEGVRHPRCGTDLRRAGALLGLLAVVAAGPAPHAAAQSNVAFPPQVYAARRARLVATLDMPVIAAGEYMVGAEGLKKQDPDFSYLTGVESPYAVLVTAPDGRGGTRDVLFLPTARQFAGAQYPYQDPRLAGAAWNHTIRRLAPGPEAEEATGVDATYPLDELATRLPELVAGARRVGFVEDGARLYAPAGLDAPLTVRQQLLRSLTGVLDGIELVDAAPAVHRMRLVKDSFEIAALRKAAAISARSMRELMGRVHPGMNDLEAAGIMEEVWKREGSPRASFAPIVASGPDAVSLFTIRAESYKGVDRVMRAGDLVFDDYGAAEWDMYASDVCRTFPVSGRFTAEQRRLYEIVLEAQEAAIAAVRPGADILDVIRAAAQVYRDHGLEPYEDIDAMGVEHVWGVMPSPTHYLARGGGLTRYTAVGGLGVRDIGHHIGLEATDSRDYSTPLEAGMVFTVEPKLYVPDLDIAIMIEDMILVTPDGHENLSAGAPKTVREIEAAMAAGRGR